MQIRPRSWQPMDWQSIANLESIQIKQLKEFKYLGSLIRRRKWHPSGRFTAGSVVAFSEFKFCMWEKTNISIRTEINLFWTLILTLLYGSEKRMLLKSDMNKPEVFKMLFMTNPGGFPLWSPLKQDYKTKMWTAAQETLRWMVQPHVKDKWQLAPIQASLKAAISPKNRCGPNKLKITSEIRDSI